MNNGYTTIEIGGKTIGLKFGLPSLRMMMEKSIKHPGMLNETTLFDETGYAYLLYSGYCNNCLVKETEPEFNFEFFMDYIEEISGDEEKSKLLANVIEVWAASRQVQRMVEKDKSAVKKKNGHSMKSKPSATVPSE